MFTNELHPRISRAALLAAMMVVALLCIPTVAQDTEQAAPARIAHVRLAGRILDSPPGFTLWPDAGKSHTLRIWLHRLAEARRDEEVKAVAIEVDSPRLSWAQAQELADAVGRIAEVKPVYTYIPAGESTPYLVASAGTEVAMDPVGSLMITGVAAELFFYRGTLDLLGIEPQFVQHGRFKGASEPMMRTEPSDEMRKMFDGLLDDLYDQLCEQIARQRDLETEQVQETIDRGPFTAVQAQQERLVDALVSVTEWRRHVAEQVADDPDEVVWMDNFARPVERKPDFSNPFALLGALLEGPEPDPTLDPTVAIVHADGMIVPGRSGEGLLGQSMVGAKTLVSIFDQLRQDDRVKAVVFRVNSPGGSALASEHIYQAVRRCAKEKPVIVSIGSVGASGGYYIALGGDEIMAEDSAMVGGVGVVGGKLAMTGLLDKIGINAVQFTRGESAGMWSSRAWTQQEADRVDQLVGHTYDVFVRRVMDSRDEKIDDVDSVTEGRIFTARQGADNGLIDRVGGMRRAVMAAQEAAGLERSHFITLPRPRTLMDMMGGGDSTAVPRPETLSADTDALLRLSALRSPEAAYLLNMAMWLDKEMLLTALPYYFRVSP